MAPDVAHVADGTNAMGPRTLAAIRVAALADRPAIRAGAFDAIDAIVMAARFGDAGASQQGKRERGRAEEAGHGWLRILWGFGCGPGEGGLGCHCERSEAISPDLRMRERQRLLRRTQVGLARPAHE